MDQYYPYTQMKGTTYEIKSLFIFRGSNVLGIPSTAKFILAVQSGATVYARIYNPVTASVVAEVSTTSITPIVISSVSLSNIPATEQILEVHMRTDNAAKTGYMYTMLFGYY